MRELIDIHSHILPELDDGANDLATTIKLLQIADKEGITEIIATPHFYPRRWPINKNIIIKKWEDVSSLIKEQFPHMTLHIGNEVFYSSDTIVRMNAEEILPLAGSKYILVEFRYDVDYNTILNAVNNLILSGYLPIIAHTERYPAIIGQIRHIIELDDMGAYIQINASSIIGDRGWKVKRFIKKLMENNLIHFVASDTHSVDERPPLLRKANNYIEKEYGKDYAKQLFYDNPKSIINHQYIR